MIAVPPFYCPIPSAESPHTAAAERTVVEWLDKFELFESPTQRDYFARSHFPAFPGRSLPDADAELLVLPGKEVMWLQSFDDVHSDEKPGATPPEEYIPLLAGLTRIMEDPQAPLLPDNPWAHALRDLRLDVGERATDVQTERWVQANVEYFDGLLWEAVNRAEGRIPSLDDYVAMWLKQSGVYPCIVFTDIACGYEVPAADWAAPRARTLREMTSVLIGWDNDLTSYDKEVARAAERNFPVVQNLVSVLAAQYALPEAEAVALAGAMRDRAMARFLALRDETVATGGPELARYAMGLGQWIRGYLDYSGRSPRYTDPTNPDDAAVADPARPGWTVADTPGPGAVRTDLPALACIDSWWA
ncbi:terpene synthase family protein [Streptomyces hyaluromycini]|uniref:terpene synthase family protein n=1 Tax=Streptomyces hyaluromycini TaxID=1377993 RepID=UPI000B5C974B|nr:hypothetical protein [Streptomyces hyaluromycini]